MLLPEYIPMAIERSSISSEGIGYKNMLLLFRISIKIYVEHNRNMEVQIMTAHSHKRCMRLDRREFMKLVAAASVVAALPERNATAEITLPNPGPETNVSLAGVKKGTSEDVLIEAVRSAAESATDFCWLSEGDSVMIKPVLNSGNPYPATTNPTGLKAVVALLKEKGAGRVVVSEMSGYEHVKLKPDGLTGSSRELMEGNGMAKAALAAGAELYFPEEDGWDAFFEDGPPSDSNWKTGITMPKILQEVDHLVLMPRCARHLLAGSTLGLKSAVGYWRADTRLEYHRDAATFHEKTAESNVIPSLLEKQRLVLTTATKTLATFGPDDGYVTEPDTGLVVASESIVAHDMVSLAWLLENRKLAPEDENDPYKSQMFVTIANKVVTQWLGGFGAALSSEKLTRHDINTIWDDRVLNRAYQLWEGIPMVNMLDANEAVSSDIKQKLEEAVSPPAAAA